MLEAERSDWSYEATVAADLDPKRWEIAGGVLVERPGMSVGGGVTLAALTVRLGAFVRAEGRGEVSVGGRFRLQADPCIERLPDLAFIARDRLPPKPYPISFEGHPDLAVEVLSPSDPVGGAAGKAREYLEHGTPEVWNVDPEAETITVYRPGVPPRSPASRSRSRSCSAGSSAKAGG